MEKELLGIFGSLDDEGKELAVAELRVFAQEWREELHLRDVQEQVLEAIAAYPYEGEEAYASGKIYKAPYVFCNQDHPNSLHVSLGLPRDDVRLTLSRLFHRGLALTHGSMIDGEAAIRVMLTDRARETFPKPSKEAHGARG